MTSFSGPIIELRGIWRTFSNGAARTDVLKEVDLSIHAGELVAIIGASGSGKSTLMNIIGLLDRPTVGRYLLAGRDVSRLEHDELARLRRHMFGFIFQQYHLVPRMTALSNVEMPTIYAGAPRGYRQQRAEALLARLGLQHRAHSLPAQMSGGQQQRVSIARALVNGGMVILADEPTGALDAGSGSEVLTLLEELAAEGHTVIVVTHDSKVAARAARVIEIEDGRVVGRTPAVNDAAQPEPTDESQVGIFDREPSWLSLFSEATRSAFAAIRGNPFRTSLTLLGIVIGVAAVIAMLAIGRGTQVSVMEKASAVGTNWVVVGRPGNSRISSQPLTEADVAALKTLPNVSGAMPRFSEQAIVRHDERDVTTQVMGTDRDFRTIHNWDAAKGSFFTEEDELTGSPVVLLGATVASRLFPQGYDPSGERVLVGEASFLVAGLLQPKGVSEVGEDRDDVVVMPLRTAFVRLFGESDLSGIVVSVRDMSRLSDTMHLIKSTLIDRHGREDFWLYDAASAFRVANETRASLNLLLGAIASISLLVGGIGVMNMMLMGVQERTKEIGIRAAVGARRADIYRQFLVEAILLSALGGICGLLIGGMIAVGFAYAFDSPVIFSTRIAVLSLVASCTMGALFGLIPARRAAGLDPVRALASP